MQKNSVVILFTFSLIAFWIVGNYDYNGNISAQILYTYKSKRW
jgi:hypothetical protein